MSVSSSFSLRAALGRNVDFNLYKPTVKADNELVIKDGLIMAKMPRR